MLAPQPQPDLPRDRLIPVPDSLDGLDSCEDGARPTPPDRRPTEAPSVQRWEPT